MRVHRARAAQRPARTRYKFVSLFPQVLRDGKPLDYKRFLRCNGFAFGTAFDNEIEYTFRSALRGFQARARSVQQHSRGWGMFLDCFRWVIVDACATPHGVHRRCVRTSTRSGAVHAYIQ